MAKDSIKNCVSSTDSPLEMAETIIRGAFEATKDLPESERIERIIYSVAAIFRDNPMTSQDGLPVLYMKLNPDRKSSYFRMEGDAIDLAAMLSRYLREPRVNQIVMLALMTSDNVKVIKI